MNVNDVWTGPVKHFKDENSPRLDSDINFCLHADICRVSVKKEKILLLRLQLYRKIANLGLAGYELIITNSAYGLVGYIYQLISGASSKNNC